MTEEKKLQITKKLKKRIFNSIRGLGLLDSIIKDDQITEVMINGSDDIFIEKAGKLYKLEQKVDDERQLEDIIQKIVGQAGREVNQANPIVDTRLPDGSRVNVVLPPISLNGATVTIRKSFLNAMSAFIPHDEREITGYENGEIQVNPIYEFREDGRSTLERVSGRLVRTDRPFLNEQKLRLAGISAVI